MGDKAKYLEKYLSKKKSGKEKSQTAEGDGASSKPAAPAKTSKSKASKTGKGLQIIDGDVDWRTTVEKTKKISQEAVTESSKRSEAQARAALARLKAVAAGTAVPGKA